MKDSIGRRNAAGATGWSEPVEAFTSGSTRRSLYSADLNGSGLTLNAAASSGSTARRAKQTSLGKSSRRFRTYYRQADANFIKTDPPNAARNRNRTFPRGARDR